MATKYVELRVDPNLVEKQFEGYKLSLETVPVFRCNHTKDVFRVKPGEDQYSLLHMRLFTMHNHLHMDPWSRGQAYLINNELEVIGTSYEENNGRPGTMSMVFQLERIERQSGDYNYSLRFISEKYCIICDGIDSLLLLNTGDRTRNTSWSLVEKCTISQHLPTTGEGDEEKYLRNYTIIDARLDNIQSRPQISLALGHIHRAMKNGSKAKGSSKHYMFIYWATWSWLSEKWQFTVLDALEGVGTLHYCAFEPKAESLIICSDTEYVWQSEKRSVIANDVQESDTKDSTRMLHHSNLSWTQKNQEIHMKVMMEMEMEMEWKDYEIQSTSPCELAILKGDEIQTTYRLFDEIVSDSLQWNLEKDCLHIKMTKLTDCQWPSLFANNAGPKEMENDVEKSNISNAWQTETTSIVNLEAPLEDCDFPAESQDASIYIYRYNLPAKAITHAIVLGSSPPLFESVVRPGFPAALVTRVDVDACVWLQQYKLPPDNDWTLRHEGNLHALGYIQASKQQKKFIDCAPDFGYSVICESQRHVFLYRAKYDTSNGLRKRYGPQVTLGKQQLITLQEDVGEVLGLVTANHVITILTEKSVLHLQIDA